MKINPALLSIFAILLLGNLFSCKSTTKLSPSAYLEELNQIKDSAAFYSKAWNQEASIVLSKDSAYATLKEKRKAFEAYSERAIKQIEAMDEPGKTAKETKAEFLKFLQQNEKMLKDLSLKMENLENEKLADSLRSKKDKIMYESQKYMSDLDDQFFRVLNYIQLYELNNKLKKEQQ